MGSVWSILICLANLEREVKTLNFLKITSFDGTVLRADVSLPKAKGSEKFPAPLLQSSQSLSLLQKGPWAFNQNLQTFEVVIMANSWSVPQIECHGCKRECHIRDSEWYEKDQKNVRHATWKASLSPSILEQLCFIIIVRRSRFLSFRTSSLRWVHELSRAGRSQPESIWLIYLRVVKRITITVLPQTLVAKCFELFKLSVVTTCSRVWIAKSHWDTWCKHKNLRTMDTLFWNTSLGCVA